MSRTDTAQVIVVGAGPVGLFLACDLARRGLGVVVLERLPDVDPLVKAGSIGPVGVELLKQAGFAEELAILETRTLERYQAMAARAGIPPEQVVPREHFAGLEKVAQRDPSRRRMRVEQPDLVRLLVRRARSLGVRVHYRHEATDAWQSSTTVTVTAETSSGPPLQISGDYLVGCDGYDSVVRKAAGIALSGTSGTVTGRQGVVSIAEPGKLRHGFHYTPRGLVVWGLGVDRVATIEFDGPPRADGPLTADELQASLRRVTGTDVAVDRLHSGSRFTDAAYLADSLRRQRMLLAGDAAHRHAPFGGQGLNAGLGDAANLGWKLAATIDGWGLPQLLDSYHAERHPAAQRLLANTRAQTALMRPDPHSAAMRDLVDQLMDISEVQYWMADLLAGTDARYDLRHAGGSVPPAGSFSPDLMVQVGDHATSLSRLAAAAPEGLLLTLGSDETVLRAAARWRGRVRLITARIISPGRSCELRALLLRPDGYVAWACTGRQPADLRGLLRALRTWFGPNVSARVASAEDQL